MITLEKIMEINPFNNQKSDKEPEKEGKVEFENDTSIEKTLDHYRQMDHTNWPASVRFLHDFEPELLTPNQINTLLQKIIQETPKQKMEHYITGMIITQIIQESYEKGHNKFMLTTKDTRIQNIGHSLKGTPENPVRISIQGNTGNQLGYHSKKCRYDINGNTEKDCGTHSKNCKYNIQGNVTELCGDGSRNCIFLIKGNAKEFLGDNSTNCKYYIKGNLKGNFHAFESKDCTFLTPNKRSYKKIEMIAKRDGEGNKIIYTGK